VKNELKDLLAHDKPFSFIKVVEQKLATKKNTAVQEQKKKLYNEASE
jgi:hypothetical protein